MDFCVRCGKKELHQEFLCAACHAQLHPPEAGPSRRKKAQPKPGSAHGRAAKRQGKHAGYFEATIQLRNVEKEVHAFAAATLGRAGIRISNERWLKHGVDLRVDDFRFARKLGRQLQARFGGLLRVTSRLFTRDRLSGKEVHRVTVLFKQFPAQVGKQFILKGSTYTVRALGRHVIAEDAGGVKRRFTFEALERGRVF